MAETMSWKERLQSGKHLYGIFVEIFEPAVMEMLALAGFDYAIIDAEHGQPDPQTVVNMIRAARLHGLEPVVRVPTNAGHLIANALDAGAAAVQVPFINGRSGAESAVQAGRFYPEGMRGLNSFIRAAGYSAQPAADFVERANAETGLILQIEGAEGVAALEDILSVPGFDVLFIGPYDLSQSLGVPGQVNSPRVTDTIERIIRTCKQHGKLVSMYCGSPEDARRWSAQGVHMIALGCDTHLFLRAARDVRKQLG